MESIFLQLQIFTVYHEVNLSTMCFFLDIVLLILLIIVRHFSIKALHVLMLVSCNFPLF